MNGDKKERHDIMYLSLAPKYGDAKKHGWRLDLVGWGIGYKIKEAKRKKTLLPLYRKCLKQIHEHSQIVWGSTQLLQMACKLQSKKSK